MFFSQPVNIQYKKKKSYLDFCISCPFLNKDLNILKTIHLNNRRLILIFWNWSKWKKNPSMGGQNNKLHSKAKQGSLDVHQSDMSVCFFTIYLEEPDSSGHSYGPVSRGVRTHTHTQQFIRNHKWVTHTHWCVLMIFLSHASYHFLSVLTYKFQKHQMMLI